MNVAAVLLAGVAAALMAGPGAGLPVSRAMGREAPRRPGILGMLAVASAAVLAAVLEGTALVLGLIGLGAAAGFAQLWRRGRRERVRELRRVSVVELGETLVGELRAGQPVLAALERGAEVWPPFGPVLAAARLGADVPHALRAVARLPGAEGLAELASAWQVAERSGAALSETLTQVVESARARASAHHLVRAELASAQATARLVAVLPVATLAMSAGVGAEPWRFLLTSPVGLACLASGVALVFVGLWWFDRIAVAVTTP